MKTPTVGLIVVLCVTLSLASTPLASGAPTERPASRAATGSVGDAASLQSNDSGITRMNISGPGVAVQQNNTTYVWQDGHTVFETTVYPLRTSGTYELCLELTYNGSTIGDHGCKDVNVSYGGRQTFTIENTSTNRTGEHQLVLTVQETNDSASLPIYAVARDGDLDDDGLTNELEVEKYGTNMTKQDTDGDGLGDEAEINEYGTDPTEADSDDDGVSDAIELGWSPPMDPQDNDTDGDGLPDGAEINEYGTDPTDADTDDDGLSDYEEVKKYDTNPRKADSDGDGVDDGPEIEQGSDPQDSNDPGDDVVTDTSVTFDLAQFMLGLGALLAVGIAAATYARTDDEPPADEGDDVGADVSDEREEDLASLDPEMLSSEQYVERLLEANGGQMKQSDIVDQTDWSKAKVSRTLSRMEDEDRIKRVRIGRGNVVTYPDNDLGDEI